MKRAVIFLHGVYRSAEIPFYKSLCQGSLRVAADGGYAFFRKAGLVADVLIGDFDSLKRIPSQLPKSTKVLKFPERKDRTDSQLALEYCLKQGIRQIDIVAPAVLEIDHFLGNVMLLQLARKLAGENSRMRLLNTRFEIELIENASRTLAGCVGDTVSVLPLSKSIRLTWVGTDYDVTGVRIPLGHSISLRNRVVKRRAVLTVEGRALLIRGRSTTGRRRAANP
jgi:thiamine pyrophosphokinase